MAGYLRVRCADLRLLVPGMNVSSIGVWAGAVRLLTPQFRMPRDGTTVLDGRRLLERPGGGTPSPCTALDWRSTDGTRRATVLVDAVEALVDWDDQPSMPLPRVPAAVRHLFDRVALDGGTDTFLLRLKLDVAWTAAGSPPVFTDLRRLRRAVVAAQATAQAAAQVMGQVTDAFPSDALP